MISNYTQQSHVIVITALPFYYCDGLTFVPINKDKALAKNFLDTTETLRISVSRILYENFRLWIEEKFIPEQPDSVFKTDRSSSTLNMPFIWGMNVDTLPKLDPNLVEWLETSKKSMSDFSRVDLNQKDLELLIHTIWHRKEAIPYTM